MVTQNKGFFDHFINILNILISHDYVIFFFQHMHSLFSLLFQIFY